MDEPYIIDVMWLDEQMDLENFCNIHLKKLRKNQTMLRQVHDESLLYIDFCLNHFTIA